MSKKSRLILNVLVVEADLQLCGVKFSVKVGLSPSKKHSPSNLNLVNKQLQYTYCPISREVKATNETWSINRMLQEKYFSSTIMQKMR